MDALATENYRIGKKPHQAIGKTAFQLERIFWPIHCLAITGRGPSTADWGSAPDDGHRSTPTASKSWIWIGLAAADFKGSYYL